MKLICALLLSKSLFSDYEIYHAVQFDFNDPEIVLVACDITDL